MGTYPHMMRHFRKSTHLHPLCGIMLQKSTLTPESHIFLESTHSPKSKMGTHVFLHQSTNPQSSSKVSNFDDISKNPLKASTLQHLISHIALGTKIKHPDFECQWSTEQFDAQFV
ncbi:hypothetical protein XENTR_v10024426 [Xenopus tropicalis]|nr:hypothetical protein XENTR_v10024426 [Xenopus tropicalis]